ncbi:ABC transporter ATP-binding protein [Mediterraneibacter sp. NSJ-55]|uniref:ABC transporter ATP-binding protein n=1 Tax=Mediterraneibacter hominis TaxID=2763054 RepID=A0A923LIX9_9FIRM|nr:ABC transporter ATP-binding protein [Mediterraneibacter hominis]MBC5689104.1 ABC transporter ATP-binding protein [Mediterraneibacter hominis]
MILQCIGLNKSFGNKKAVNDFNIKLTEGKVYGLLGENGSGKTTWMKMVAGLTKPTSGEIIYKEAPWNYKDKSEIAYMSTEPFFYDFMSIKDVGRYYADFFEDFDTEKFQKMTDKVGLEESMKIKTLSTGMTAKLKVVATLSRNASLFLLDEPLNGIDFKAREEIISIILDEADSKNCFVISTHLINEIESFIDEAIFVKNGQLILQTETEKERMQNGKSIADIYMEIM